MDFQASFALIIGVCGIYCLYLWVKILITKQVPKDFVLLSKEYPIEKCKEPEAFRTYLKPRLLVFSLVVTVFGLFGAANSYFGLIDGWLSVSGTLQMVVSVLLTCVIPLAALIWFAVCISRAQKRMW